MNDNDNDNDGGNDNDERRGAPQRRSGGKRRKKARRGRERRLIPSDLLSGLLRKAASDPRCTAETLAELPRVARALQRHWPGMTEKDINEEKIKKLEKDIRKYGPDKHGRVRRAVIVWLILIDEKALAAKLEQEGWFSGGVDRAARMTAAVFDSGARLHSPANQRGVKKPGLRADLDRIIGMLNKVRTQL